MYAVVVRFVAVVGSFESVSVAAAAAAVVYVVVVVPLPFLFIFDVFFLYSACQRPFMKLPSGVRLGLPFRLCRRRLCPEKGVPGKGLPTSFIVSHSYLPFVLLASTAHTTVYFLNCFSSCCSTQLITTENFVFNTSLYMSPLCFWFVFCNLFLQVRNDCVYCKGTIKDNDIFIGLCKASLHFSCSKRSRKLFTAQVEQVQGGRYAKFGEKARAELEKSEAKREG